MSVNVRDRQGRVEAMQKMLRELGMRWGMTCLCVQVSGCFDAATEEAVRAFQEHECMPVTGICDRETWDCLSDCCRQEREECAPVTVSILPRDCEWCLSPGEEDDAVFLLQYMLRALAGEYDLAASKTLSRPLAAAVAASSTRYTHSIAARSAPYSLSYQ